MKEILEKLFSRFHSPKFKKDSSAEIKTGNDEQPLRSELFNTAQLKDHAKNLASRHETKKKHEPDRLIARLAKNEEILLESYELISSAVKGNRQISPAAEWLIDNFYLIEEQIRTARLYLPKKYSRELPQLKNGPWSGFPRVYEIAIELISHVDGRLDAENLIGFVASYQTIAPLKLGELWAMPIMLRLALIENLRRVAAGMMPDRIDRDHANYWADRMTETVEKDPKNLILVMADMARANPPNSGAFVAEFARRLQGQSPALAYPLTLIEMRLSEENTTIEQLVQMEHQKQAADQVSIGNSIGSLRFLGGMDWREFVETLSESEKILRMDPSNTYGNMNFSSRDIYRHAVENISKHTNLSEEEVAGKAIEFAKNIALTKGRDDREAHVGFYLIDKGLHQLEKQLKARFSFVERLQRLGRKFPFLFYLGSIFLITAMITLGLVWQAHLYGFDEWILVLIGLLSIILASHLAVAWVNWTATLLVRPKILPKMDFSKEIPSDLHTLVVIPTLLTSPQGIHSLLEGIEVRYLANRDKNLHFALLTDFGDAAQESMPGDDQLVALIKEGIEGLNEKYTYERSNAFFLFHRPRKWNEKEKIWMGHERKRGKLSDLNCLLRGGPSEKFSLILGETSILNEIKYVITLDTDTQLPRDTARQLVGTIAHPLNKPVYDPKMQIVVEGYTILQPRVSVSLVSTDRSWFAKVFGGQTGIDPYTNAVSDVYQDVFLEGSFIGKGIYEVDTFQKVLENRFPDNRILSHDLLEGCYARSALATDIELFEDYPPVYTVDMKRRHRWIRGDWQIAAWLMPRVPAFEGKKKVKNPISMLSRWKIFDNLRRSFVPCASFAFLILGWTLLKPAWFWTLSILGIIFAATLLSSLVKIFQKPADTSYYLHGIDSLMIITRQLTQILFNMACLPFETFKNLDAIARTWTRMFITRRKLLEWQTVTDSEHSTRSDILGFYLSMWPAPLIAISLISELFLYKFKSLTCAWPLIILWFYSPFIAWLMSRPAKSSSVKLSEEQLVFLVKIARKTWRFFETFVGEEDHWLPPDNFQEYPAPVIAHRTSPTNIGLSLLANLSAYDFGYISCLLLIDRTSKTLNTMERMEKFHNHFFNWYDTHTLQVLPPRYISTVDSGNLAGHLLILQAGFLELPSHRILSERLFDGLRDTIAVLIDENEKSKQLLKGAGNHLSAKILTHLKKLQHVLNATPHMLSSARSVLEHLVEEAKNLLKNLNPSPHGQVKWWAEAFERQCQDHLNYLLFQSPWLLLSVPSEKASSQIKDLLLHLDQIHTLNEAAKLEQTTIPRLDELWQLAKDKDDEKFLLGLKQAVVTASNRASEKIAIIQKISVQCGDLASMEYEFLYDKPRRLLSIGYNVADRRKDTGCYDLLASEARLCSFVAIAQGQLPQEHWFALGRLLTNSVGKQALLSWSGSMFEYLMPLLVMPNYENTLLDQTYKAVVERQMEYAAHQGIPWGISESGYNVMDAHLNYQYRAFGVPGLGFKRGLADDLVIAPYACVMALMIFPEEACENLQDISSKGYEGHYGFFEAVDYTPGRLGRGQTQTVIHSFMAHHQGISFLSISHLLLNKPMQKRFASNPLFRATELLLQERIPKTVPIYPHASEVSESRTSFGEPENVIRFFKDPATPSPEIHLLSNSRYNVMITHAGSGYSAWKNLMITRWREDTTLDNWGSFCYVKDVVGQEIWSTTYQPTLKASKTYEAIFSQAKAEFRRQDHEINLHTEVTVSPEDDIELRRITLINRSRMRRTLELTTYSEIVLAPLKEEATHPVFNGLFIHTEIVKDKQAVICTRRPRSSKEQPPYLFHLMTVHGTTADETSYETDKSKFIGRGKTAADPDALKPSSKLSDSEGPVLDPILSIRQKISIEPDETVVIDIVTGITETRDTAIGLIDKYHDRRLADRVFDLAWTHRQAVLNQLNITQPEAMLYERLANSIMYANSRMRAASSVLIKNRRGQSDLWGYGISGDLPLVIVRIGDQNNVELVRQLVHAHAHWRMSGVTVDLLIWNDVHSSYRQLLQDQIMSMLTAGAQTLERPGGIFLRRGDQISEEDQILIQTVARIIISDNQGTLAEQIEKRRPAELRVSRFKPQKTHDDKPFKSSGLTQPDLVFFNGFGGFTKDGREYVIITSTDKTTPAPWVNVIANPHFGTVISESGGGYTWNENAHEFRLTPWFNDPVGDSRGEAFYIRDEETGRFWSPTPLPAPAGTSYITRHGFGYSVFECKESGIKSELTVYVAIDSPVKFALLKVRNESGRPRQLSATAYYEWVLGQLRTNTLMHIITEIDSKSGALLAHNPYNTEFRGRVAFLDINETSYSFTADRTEFLGRNGTLNHPSAMSQMHLSGKAGAGLDPCAAMQVQFDLSEGQEREIVFTLGAGKDIEEARNLVQKFHGIGPAHQALGAVWKYWKQTLGSVYVETPETSVNFMANGWLLYQTLSCRLWARSGYYQSGGAFGFRDQLQDVMALVLSQPGLTREHILRCSEHQFREGDVQHWWHPPLQRGVRTHFSDDFLWLPFVAHHYVKTTGDLSILDEITPFLEGRSLNLNEEAYYDMPVVSEETGTLYEHCVRAILYGLKFGVHGLPLIGRGDWNDGMNLVGELGKGESVWLAFFLYDVLTRFSDIAQQRGDSVFSQKCIEEAKKLKVNIQEHAWDGNWYIRAFFDNGDPLGSSKNPECQIDSIPQSWSVLSGAGDIDKSLQAMQFVDEKLVQRKNRLIQLFNPPFDKSGLNPGYIKGYLPGIRENGGQYTHAAIWAIMAFAGLGNHQKAWELFSLINPIHHGNTPKNIASYKVEPYVISADVYALPPHIGRGGWTWYTGSAGWMYRLLTESLLGLNLNAGNLQFSPRIPDEWTSYKVNYQYQKTLYRITFTNTGAKKNQIKRVMLDNTEQEDKIIHLMDDGNDHIVSVEID